MTGGLRLGAWDLRRRIGGLRRGMLGAALVASIAVASPHRAYAQAASAAAGHPVQLSVGGLVFGETSFDSINAEYIANNGSRQVVFRTENALRPGFGLEVHLGIGLTRAFEVEATGSWSRADHR